MKVSVHVERLVLEGLPVSAAQGGLVRAAVEEELSRLLAAGELDPALVAAGSLPRLEAGALRLEEQTDPARVGRQIARAVYEGVGR
jgi:hypothetical protein